MNELCANSERTIITAVDTSETFNQAMIELLDDGIIRMHRAHPLIYLIDGLVYNLPIAKRANHKYKTPHWLPVTIELSNPTVKKPSSAMGGRTT